MPDSTISTILLVDDDSGNRQLMAWAFRDAGYRVLEAGTGAEALRLAATRPHLAVLDVNLPDVSGFEVCQRIKADPATRGISVVHLSGAFVDSDDRTQGLEQGADAYLIKPVDDRELLATVKALLRVRAAEAAASRAAQEWRTTFDAIGDGVALIDPIGRVRRGNVALAEMLGEKPEALVGRSLEPALRALGGPGAADLGWLTEAARTRRTEEVKLGRLHLRVTIDPIAEDADGPPGRVVIVRDITGQKELEDRLRQSQHLEAIGRLAGGVAHEFNNLLMAIVGNLSVLSSTTQDPTDAALLAAVERSAWRAAGLPKQLLGFSRQALLWLRPVDPSALLTEVLEPFATGGLPAGGRLEDRRAGQLSTIHADPEQVKQILNHLLAHAAEAVPGGGTVTVGADDVTFGPDDAAEHADARPGRFVRISVADSGRGLSPEAVQRVFEPFFSPDEGTGGLGLAMAYGTARQHGGWLECDSAPGRGTRFDLYLPCLEPETDPAVRAAR